MAADRAHANELAVVYRDHARAVYGLARRVCGPALAADVTQEVFLSYWRGPEWFDPTRSSLRSFLLTITYRRAIDALRSESARRHREERTTRCPDVVPDAHQQLVERERSATIAGAMGALSTLERQAVVAAYYGDCTYQEVAQALGVPLGTIKSRIRSGLAKLHDALGELRLQPQDEPRRTSSGSSMPELGSLTVASSLSSRAKEQHVVAEDGDDVVSPSLLRRQ